MSPTGQAKEAIGKLTKPGLTLNEVGKLPLQTILDAAGLIRGKSHEVVQREYGLSKTVYHAVFQIAASARKLVPNGQPAPRKPGPTSADQTKPASPPQPVAPALVEPVAEPERSREDELIAYVQVNIQHGETVATEEAAEACLVRTYKKQAGDFGLKAIKGATSDKKLNGKSDQGKKAKAAGEALLPNAAAAYNPAEHGGFEEFLETYIAEHVMDEYENL